MNTANRDKKISHLSYYKPAIICFMFFLAIALLTACGGGGGGGSETSSLNSGKFIDSPIEGLEYHTATQSGTTDSQGNFRYEAGEEITFSIGDLVLGTTLAKGIVTPLDLVPGAQDETDPAVTNMLRLLQSLDADGDPDNSIQITPQIAYEVSGRQINFDSDVESFDNEEIGDLFDALNAQEVFSGDMPRSLRTAEEARQHFRIVLTGQLDPTEVTALFSAVPEPVIVHEQIIFDATGSTGAISEYLWDFGDGQNGFGVEVSHTYQKIGTFQVTLTVIADNDKEASSFQEIVVNEPPNEPPVAMFTPKPATGQAPIVISFTPTGSTDPDGEIIQYAWDFGDGKRINGRIANHTYAEPGSYTAKLTVTDNNGATDEATFEVIITGPEPNEAPTALFTASPETGEAPLQVAFNGSASSDPDGNIASYSWNFGDGQTGSGKNSSHSYSEPGIYEARLTVRDNMGATASANLEIIVLESTIDPDCSTNPCDEHATCDDGGAEITCSCNSGWTGDGYTCSQIVNECENDDTLPNGGSACGFNNRGEYGQICVNNEWQNNSAVCDDPDVCTDENILEGTGSCGLNGNGTMIQVCVEGQWTEACDDSDVCENSDMMPDGGSACGLNNRGEFGQICVAGAWQDNTATCADPDVCTDESITEGTDSCGFNGNGTLMQICVEGQWVNSEECDDPDVCTNGHTREGATPCSGGYYMQLCENGQWSDTTDCSSPAEDTDGDLVDAADDPNDDDYTVCGDSDGDGCDDCSVSGIFDPDNDGWDRNGDGDCELPLDYDCMNGANAATDPYRLQSCIMFTYINQDREHFAAESDNAAPLRWNEAIWEVAKAHTVDMCENEFFNHYNLANQSPSDRAAAAGLPYGLAENIAINLDPGAAQYAFMEEPTCVGHRANVLEPRAIEVGIGYHTCNNSNFWNGYQFVTQNFRWNFSIGASAYCQNSSLTCQIPPNPPTTAPCPDDLIGWGFCPVPSEDTLQGWCTP